jgi:hypothetical protein
VTDMDSWTITRQHVVDLLPIMRLSPSQEARLLACPTRSTSPRAARAFESVGVGPGRAHRPDGREPLNDLLSAAGDARGCAPSR